MTAVWIIIPAHNEATNIVEVVNLCQSYGRVLVVDDGSTDNTGALAAEAGARVLVNPRGAQHGHGIRAGIKYVLHRFPLSIVTIDAGLSYQPADIPRLLEALTGADIVVGSRVIAGSWRQQPWQRRLLTTTATHFLGLLTGGPSLDYTSFRAYTPRAAGWALDLSRDLDMRCHVFNPQLIYRLWCSGLCIKQVPVGYTATNSTLDSRTAISALWGILSIWQASQWEKKLRC